MSLHVPNTFPGQANCSTMPFTANEPSETSPILATPLGSPSPEDAISTPLFVQREAPLLPTPQPTKTADHAARRKTLALGFSLSRRSARLKAKNRGTPVAQMAQKILCQRVGITHEGNQITEEAISKFPELF